MSSVVIAGNTSGTITLDAPNVAGTTVLTLPTANGTVLTTASSGVVTQAMLSTNVAGNGPVFSYYNNGGSYQSIGAGAYTKITLNTASFDTTSGMFASSRFTPTVAGYYQLSFVVGGNVNTETIACLYKNGGLWHYGSDAPNSYISTGSAVVYANGSTDYFELYAFSTLANNIYQNINRTYFTGVLVRAA
jgi:hypothetical protein